MFDLKSFCILTLICNGMLAAGAPLASGDATSIAVTSSPVGSDAVVSATSFPPATATVPPISTDPNLPLWNESTPGDVQPVRGQLGADLLGPINEPIQKQNPDLLAPPTTDHGSIQNAKWPFALSHNRLQTGGWARQQTINDMPISVEMAGVNMRLEAGAIRELHWHTQAEWAYVLKGTTQVTAVDQDGRNFLANVGPGDLWYFPPGIPHSLQATDDNPDGSEFLLVFDDGAFSEDGTFLLTDWLAHVPYEVLQKNFQLSDPDAFSHVPSQELYIFPSNPPNTTEAPDDPQGQVPEPFFFPFSQQNATQLRGGSIKIADSTTFTISKTIAVAEVTIEPGAMRELHWHPTQAEWDFFLEGEARITIFAAQSNARTFDYQPGDIAYVPPSNGHYIENRGNTTVKYLEIFRTDVIADVSLNQWLALIPPDLVKAHLGLDETDIAELSKVKPIVIGPSQN